MKEASESPIFETKNVDLASFLIFEGVKFLECKRDSLNGQIIIMRFLDSKRSCIDLERVFLGSDFKRFRDINKYLLSKIHEKKNE